MKHKKILHKPELRFFLLILFVVFAFLSLRGREASAAAGDLLVADETNIKLYNGTTGAFGGVFVAAGSGGLSRPLGMTYGPDGKLYVSSYDNDRVIRYNGKTGAVIGDFVAAGSGGLDGPLNLTFGPDGNLYVISYNNNKLLRYNGTTGAFIDEFVPQDGTLLGPIDLAFSPGGDLYVSSSGSLGSGLLYSIVSTYNGANGTFLGSLDIGCLVNPDTGCLDGPQGLVFGPDGDLYISSYYKSSVVRYDLNTSATLGAFASGISLPAGLVFGPDNNLYVSVYGADKVSRFNGATGAYIDDFVVAGSGGLNLPTFLTFTPPLVYYNITESTSGSGSGTVSCSPSPVERWTDSACTISPSLNNHVSNLAVGPAGQALTPVGPLLAYTLKNVMEDKAVQATFAGNHIWLLDSNLTGETITTTINAALTQAALLNYLHLRIESGGYFEETGVSCSSSGTVVPTLSGGWSDSLNRGTSSTIISPQLIISENCTLIIDQISVQ
ncbi:MAG: hypothetical protein C0402_14615 [Thermodesulfovibrio sp.]|nr:hypothetical protein [Thermodesulfovibrio sp.]